MSAATNQKHRSPHEVDDLALCGSLLPVVSKRTGGKGVPNGTTFPFERADIEQALRDQHIQDSDMSTAIESGIINQLLEEKEGKFYLTRKTLTAYHSALKHI